MTKYYVLERNCGNGWYDQCISNHPIEGWDILYIGSTIVECQQALLYDIEQ